jgi:hypothetical protein
MADQLDFGVNWVKGFQLEDMDTFNFFLFNMDHVLTCRCSSALPFYAVNLVPLAFFLLRIISSHDLKKLKDQHSVIKKLKK